MNDTINDTKMNDNFKEIKTILEDEDEKDVFDFNQEDLNKWSICMNNFIEILTETKLTETDKKKYIIIGTPKHGEEIFMILNAVKHLFKDSSILKDIVVFTEDYNYSTTVKHFNMDHLIYQSNAKLYYKMLSGFRCEIVNKAWPYIIEKTIEKFKLRDKIIIISVGHDHLLSVYEKNRKIIPPLQYVMKNKVSYIFDFESTTPDKKIEENPEDLFKCKKIPEPFTYDSITLKDKEIEFIDTKQQYINYDIRYLDGLDLFDNNYINSHGFNEEHYYKDNVKLKKNYTCECISEIENEEKLERKSSIGGKIRSLKKTNKNIYLKKNKILTRKTKKNMKNKKNKK